MYEEKESIEFSRSKLYVFFEYLKYALVWFNILRMLMHSQI